MSYLPDLEEEDDGVSRAFFGGDSPLGKLANLSLDKASKRISKPRPIGLNGTERMSLQMLFETRPSPSSSQQSPVDTVNIDGLTLDFPRPPLTISPSPSVSTSPSTPGMPLTPSSSDSEHETFEMPVKPLSFASKSSTPEKDSLSQHDTMTRRLFAPLDTVAANKLSLGLNPELELSLTGMLEEMRERKAGQDEDEDDESARYFLLAALPIIIQILAAIFLTSSPTSIVLFVLFSCRLFPSCASRFDATASALR